MADVLGVLPFGNMAVIVSVTGKELLTILEWSVYYLTGDAAEDLKGAFLQFSGIQVRFRNQIRLRNLNTYVFLAQVTYNLSQPANSKVVSAQVRCANCSVPTFSDLVETETYSVIVTDYMYSGGDGYDMLSGLEYKTLGEYFSD